MLNEMQPSAAYCWINKSKSKAENTSMGVCFNSITQVMIIHWSGKAFLNIQENPKIRRENLIHSNKNEKKLWQTFFLT